MNGNRQGAGISTADRVINEIFKYLRQCLADKHLTLDGLTIRLFLLQLGNMVKCILQRINQILHILQTC